MRFALSEYFRIAFILSKVKWGFKIFERSLNLGKGEMSFILVKKSSTSASENSFLAAKFLFLLFFFLRIMNYNLFN
ncbi:MAG: hypothetical protein ACTHL3_00890 [Candidatus Nitrosocosmicus sp.]